MTKNSPSKGLPFERSWWIDSGKVIGGRFPGTPDPVESARLLSRLLEVGVGVVVSLQDENEPGADGSRFPDYVALLQKLGVDRGVQVRAHRFPIRDMDVPTIGRMQQILKIIDEAASAGQIVYVHCWGGHGRTGTVAGCWLVSNGTRCDDALQMIESARRHDPYLARFPAPQTQAQRDFIRGWPRRARSQNPVH